MKKICCLLTMAILCCLPGPSYSQSLPDSTKEQVRKLLERFKLDQHIPGLSFAFIADTTVVYSLALGETDIEKGTTTTINSKFPIMSVTKTFVASMLMQLVEKGIVDADDPVSKYLPEYKVNLRGHSPTTLLQLASHTSGLPRNPPGDVKFAIAVDRWMNGANEGKLEDFATVNEVIASLKNLELDFAPYDFVAPSDRHYSNLAFSILGVALERASKTKFEDYVMKNILRPTGMLATGFLTENDASAKIAAGYRFDKLTNKYSKAGSFKVNYAVYPGGMYSTAHDLARYVAAQYADKSFLSADSRARMRMQKIGWKPAYPYVLHEGGFPGYRSMVVFEPGAKFGWVVLTNENDVDFNQLNNAVAAIAGKLRVQQVGIEAKKFAGSYQLPGGNEKLLISLSGDTLYTNYPGGGSAASPVLMALSRDGSNRFHSSAPNGNTIGYDFVVDPSTRKINRLRLGQMVWYKQ